MSKQPNIEPPNVEDLQRQLDELSREHSQLNDRYMSLLRDQRIWSDQVRDAALWQARFHASVAIREAWRSAPSIDGLLWLISQLDDRPKPTQVQNLRLQAGFVKQQWNDWRDNPAEVNPERIRVLREQLRAEHHDSVLRWQAAGGVDDGKNGGANSEPGANRRTS